MIVFYKTWLTRWPVLLLPILVAFKPAASAQEDYPPSNDAPAMAASVTPAQPAFSQQELDQMLAPIALYPDSLLSQLLMASTYPLEVVEAARWSRANPNLNGEDAVRANQQRNWDPSVKSLTAFPRILQMMDEKLDWTERLGDAFLSQQAQVMDTVQHLRQKAYAAGNLRSNDQVRVDSQGQTIIVEPANPEVVYVPYYDPAFVYGPWWWPDYPPVYWAPWPGYYVQSGFAWGIGIFITNGFFFGDCDWRHHRVDIVRVDTFYYHRMLEDGRRITPFVNATPGEWRHDPDHRRGVPYRDISLQNRFGRVGASPESRRNFRGYDQSSSAQTLPREGNISGGTSRNEDRDRRGDRNRPEAQPRPDTSGGFEHRQFERDRSARPSEPRVVTPPAAETRPPVFEGIGRGPEVRNYGSRGHSSFEGATQSQHNVTPQRQPASSAGTRGGDTKHFRQ